MNLMQFPLSWFSLIYLIASLVSLFADTYFPKFNIFLCTPETCVTLFRVYRVQLFTGSFVTLPCIEIVDYSLLQ